MRSRQPSDPPQAAPGPAASPPEAALAADAGTGEAYPAATGEGAGVGGQAMWTVLDQVLSSLANFGLMIAVARAVDEHVGGVFAYVFLVFSFAMGISRAVSTDPLTIRYSAARPELRATAISRASAGALSIGLLAGLVCAAVGLVIGGELGAAMVLLLVVLPGQFLQDSWRSAAFTSRNARAAAINDAVRLVVLAALVAVAVWSGTEELHWYLGAWAASAWLAALLGMRQFSPPAWPRGVRSWLRENAGISVRLGTGFVVNQGSVTLTTSLLTAILGLAATGGLRFAQSILGPIQVLFGALSAFMVPLLARRLAAQAPRALRKPSIMVGLGAFGVSALVVAVLLVIPDSVGVELLGRSWDGARAVMLPVGVAQCLIALALGGSLPLTAMGRADQLLRVVMVQAPLLIGLGLLGAAWSGINGAAWGFVVAQATGCVLVLALAWRATSSRTPVSPVGGSPA